MLNALWPFWVSPIWKDYKNKNRLSEIRRKSGLLCLFRYLDSLGNFIEEALRIIPSQAGICDGFSIAVFAHLLGSRL